MKNLLTTAIAILFAGATNAPVFAQDIPPPGEYSYQIDVDEFTDKESYWLFFSANELGNHNEPMVMNIFCYNDETGLLFDGGGYVYKKTYDDNWEADYRIDDNPGKTFEAYASYKSFSPKAPSQDIPLIKEFFNHETLKIRFRTADGIPTHSFNISDLATAIKPIRENCGW